MFVYDFLQGVLDWDPTNMIEFDTSFLKFIFDYLWSYVESLKDVW